MVGGGVRAGGGRLWARTESIWAGSSTRRRRGEAAGLSELTRRFTGTGSLVGEQEKNSGTNMHKRGDGRRREFWCKKRKNKREFLVGILDLTDLGFGGIWRLGFEGEKGGVRGVYIEG